MAKNLSKDKKLVAKLVTEAIDRKPCAFCQRETDDEITYGKMYSIGNIQCHYFCVLLSCCLMQKGKDEDGLFGFLYPDILAELERSKKHRCSYCGRGGATLGCSLSQCRKQFHLPCGRERNAVSLFFGNFKSFCVMHAPKQKVAEDVMAKARVRMQADRKKNRGDLPITTNAEEDGVPEDTVCVICYEEVQCYPTPLTFWPPCCARDKWFHRACVQRMALSAGMHYLKCPLCNDKDSFYQAVISQGYYVPDRDAAWELEQDAFADIYSRELVCHLHCLCPRGRDHDADSGPWEIKLCLLCGSVCAHAHCLLASGCAGRYVCDTCQPAAPGDLEELAATVEKVALASQVRCARAGPAMPSRMSLRRTKLRQPSARNCNTSTSQTHLFIEQKETSDNVTTSRQDLNLKTPRRLAKDTETILKDIENKLLSPTKLIEQRFKEKVKNIIGEAENVAIEQSVLEEVRHKFKKPKPWSEKKKIVDNILEDLVSDIIKQKKPKTKEPVREWCSPKKEAKNDIQEAQQNIEDIKSEIITITNTEQSKTDTPQKCIKTLQKSKNTPKKTITQSILNKTPQKVITPRKKTLSNNETPQETLSPKKTADGDQKTNNIESSDDDSTSTFELPPEFIAEDSNSLPAFDTPKKLKTIDIQKDSSMEISESNDGININLVQIKNENDIKLKLDVTSPIKTEKCAFKFSPKDKESLQKNNINIDLEIFKNQYLNEVDRDFQCNYSHKHGNSKKSFKLQTAIDFAIDAVSKRKRENKSKKSRKRHRSAENRENSAKRRKLEEDAVKLDRKSVKKNKKFKLSLVYAWKSNTSLNLSPTKSGSHKTLKQYVLKYADNSCEMISKPEKEVTPIKKKHFKNEKSPDNLIQTSIQSFFKSKSSK